MSRAFDRVLKRCVASWNLLKYKAISARTSAHRVLRDWEDLVSEDELRSVEGSIEPYDFQKVLYGKLESLAGSGGLLVVEAPTASGKTEAVAAAFFSQLAEGDWWLAPRLMYTLPTRALTLTSYVRLCAYSKGVAGLLGLKPLPVSFEYGSTFTAKHYLYGAPVVASTLDAAAYGYVAQRVPGKLKNPRLSLPTALLATSLAVLDEVQLYQDEHYYSPAVIGMLLRPLVSAGAVVVIMSATLPSLLLEELVGSFEYERITSQGVKRGKVAVDIDFLRSGRELPDALDEREVLHSIREALSSGSVLIVSNTVKRAIECYGLLKKHFPGKVLLLHGKLTNSDRERREERLFGERLVVVSTQVVEAGFDFDANLMITELAPLDSLIQRAGRVARQAGASGKVLVFNVADPRPYASGLVRGTRALLLETNGKALEESLHSVEAAREHLDEVYIKPFVEQLKEAAAQLLLETEAYLRSLRLFSSPPEEDFKLREGFYVTVVVPEVYERLLQERTEASAKGEAVPQGTLDKLTTLLNYFKAPSTAREKRRISFTYEELGLLQQLLEKASLSLGFEEVRGPAEGSQPKSKRRVKKESKKKVKEGAEVEVTDILAARLSIEKKLEEKVYTVALYPFENEKKLLPFRTYVLKPGYYDAERGLAVRDSA